MGNPSSVFLLILLEKKGSLHLATFHKKPYGSGCKHSKETLLFPAPKWDLTRYMRHEVCLKPCFQIRPHLRNYTANEIYFWYLKWCKVKQKMVGKTQTQTQFQDPISKVFGKLDYLVETWEIKATVLLLFITLCEVINTAVYCLSCTKELRANFSGWGKSTLLCN